MTILEDTLPLWEIRNLSKAFPGVQALEDVSLSVRRGEVHALIGENGSGKSTLAKCLAGVHQPESGQMLLNGEAMVFHHPLDAKAHGVATIYQEFSIIPTLSVAENIFLGRPILTRRTRLIDWERLRQETLQTLDQLGIYIDPREIVQDLSVAEQQLVEISKAISQESTLLIMDEPTAALGLGETQRLLGLIRRLAAQGKAILYISHRLDEVFEVADRVTVLKDGHLVGTQRISDLKMNDVVRMMVGVDISQHYPKEIHRTSEPILEVEDISTDNGIEQVSFTVHAGEVFGLGGMVGAGRTEIAQAIFGIDRKTTGKIKLNGKEVNFSSPAHAIHAGVGLISENRKADGLFFNFEGPENITIANLSSIRRGLFLDLGREERLASQYIDKLNITKTALHRSVRFLSGGNQQKVVIARWLFSKAKLLILDEPTQGIDIGAKLEVYGVINELTEQGIGIILISSDYPELLAMSDRIAIVRDGKILHTAEANQLSEYQLMAIASGADPEELTGSGLDLQALAAPHIRLLSERLGLEVQLGILDLERFNLEYLLTFKQEQFDYTGMNHMVNLLGSSPAIGKVLLAFNPERVSGWLEEHADQLEVASQDFLQELEGIRQAGYAIEEIQFESGARGMAAPILDSERKAVAAIGVRGSEVQMPSDLDASTMRTALVNTALTISHDLGYKNHDESTTSEPKR
jgi:ribose transport system ATP-binding protein